MTTSPLTPPREPARGELRRTPHLAAVPDGGIDGRGRDDDHPVRARFGRAVAEGDLRTAEALVRLLLSDGLDFAEVCDRVLAPTLAELTASGTACVARRAGVLVTALVSRLRSDVPACRGLVLVAADPGPGFVQGYMLAAALERRGWQTSHLGAVCPHDVDELATGEEQPVVLVAAVGAAGPTAAVRDWVRRARRRLADSLVLVHAAGACPSTRVPVHGAELSTDVREGVLLVERRTAPLSDRELRVLDLVTHGHTNREIAELLHVAPSTVKSHLDRVFDKLHCPDRAAAAALAVRRGWIS